MQKLLLLVGLCVLVAHLEATCSQKRVCTFQSVSNLNTANLNDFDMASHMEPELCTHIIFKSVQPSAAMQIPLSALLSRAPILDHQDFKTEFTSATTKTLLEVDLTQTSSAIFAPSNRDNHFIPSVIRVVNAAGFDGVNILWMKSGSSNPAVKRGFTLLMQELKLELGERLLTASVSGVPSVIDDSYEVPQLAEFVDFFNVMTADRDRTISDTDATGGGAASPFPNAIAGMQKLVEKGAPTAKLNMGIATYGYDTGNDANPRILPNYEVCADTPPMVHIDSNATIDAKAQYIEDENFGGAFMTSLELDDFAGVCTEGDFPVIQRVKDKLCP